MTRKSRTKQWDGSSVWCSGDGRKEHEVARLLLHCLHILSRSYLRAWVGRVSVAQSAQYGRILSVGVQLISLPEIGGKEVLAI